MGVVKYLVVLAVLTVALVAAGSAQARPLASTSESLDSILGDLPQLHSAVIDGDYIYWVDTKLSFSAGFSSSVVQRTISTGAQRVIYSSTRSIAVGVRAGAGRVAFSTLALGKTTTSTLWSMNATDVAPVALGSRKMHEKRVVVYKHRKGKRVRKIKKTTCGKIISVVEVSSTGQLLGDDMDVSCTGAFRQKLLLFAPGSNTGTIQAGGDQGLPIAFNYNMLLLTDFGHVLVRDIVGSNSRDISYPAFVTAAAVNPDGWIATSGIRPVGKKRLVQGVDLYAPGAKTPAFSSAVDSRSMVDLVFCGDSLLQVTLTGKRAAVFTLRDFAGGVITQTTGPRSDEYAAARCTGRHLLSVSLHNGAPMISEYDL